MTETGLILVFLAAVLTALSNFTLRAGIERAGGFIPTFTSITQDMVILIKQPLFLLGLTMYASAALVWFRVISTENLNASYPVLIGMTFLIVTIGATVLLHEALTWPKAIGLFLIFIGIVVVSRF